MSDQPQNDGGLSKAIPDSVAVASISTIRSDSVLLLDKVQLLLDELCKAGRPAGREIAIVKTKLQEARMWAGMGLSHFNTDFEATDMPDKPESDSKLKE